MKTRNKWTDDQHGVLVKIIEKFDGSPAGAFEKHPEWRELLGRNHSKEALYAKLHVMKKVISKKRPLIRVTTTVKAAQEAPMANRLLVVTDGQLQMVRCPECEHQFKVMQAPA